MSDMLQQHLDAGNTVWVSITGLQFKRPWNIVPFLWHAIPSKMQADQSPGILKSEVKNIDGVRHTLTVWKSQQDMIAFAYSGRHQKAIAAFMRFFTGKTYGYETTDVPDWEQARKIWEEKGREYTPPRKPVK